MTMKKLFGRILSIALALGVVSMASGQTPPTVSAEAGAAAIRLFEGDPTMVLPAPRRVNPGRESLEYVLDDGRRYEVDAQTGKVWRVGYLGPGSEPEPGGKMRITPKQAEEIALTYARSHFADFMRNSIKTTVRSGGDIYSVMFQQQVAATGAELPNFAYVSVHATTGAVFIASLRDGNPIPAASAADGARISKDEAVRTFARAAGMISVTSVQTADLRWIRKNGDRLVWTLTLKGIFPGEIHGARGGSVDARTGSVLSVRRPQSFDYKIVKGPHGPESRPAQGPAVPAAGSLDGADGGSLGPPGGLPAAAGIGLVSAAVLAGAAAALMLRRRCRAPVTGAQTGHLL